MYGEPPKFDREALVHTLQTGWGLTVSSIRYEPVGFGTHHYVARDATGTAWFVNVDDLASKAWLSADPRGALDALDRAFRTAVALRRARLEFVHAPLERRDGGTVTLLGESYGVSVFAYIDGSSNADGEFASDTERRRVLAALGRMHAASDAVPSGLPRRDTLEVPLRRRFFESLDDLDSAWTGGPFSEPARDLVGKTASVIRERFDRYDELARAVGRDVDNWVVTHGEPHGGNVMRAQDDTLLLVDWDTAALGPRERDLWMIEPRSDEDWTAYTSAGGTSEINPSAIALYRHWWTLAEIAGYTDTFRSRHDDDPNTRVAWKDLQTYLPISVSE